MKMTAASPDREEKLLTWEKTWIVRRKSMMRRTKTKCLSRNNKINKDKCRDLKKLRNLTTDLRPIKCEVLRQRKEI
jgi:hypothetical protein